MYLLDKHMQPVFPVISRHLQQWSNSYFTFRCLGTTSREEWKFTDPVTRALAVYIMWQPSPVDLENSTIPIKPTIIDRWRQTSLSDSRRHTWKHRTFPLNISKLFVTVRVTKHWHRLPKEVVGSPMLGDCQIMTKLGPGQRSVGALHE